MAIVAAPTGSTGRGVWTCFAARRCTSGTGLSIPQASRCWPGVGHVEEVMGVVEEARRECGGPWLNRHVYNAARRALRINGEAWLVCAGRVRM